MSELCKGKKKNGQPCGMKTLYKFCHYHREAPEECPICTESISKKDILECGHFVHMSCIEKSFKVECPICRHPLKRISRATRKKIEKNDQARKNEESVNTLMSLLESNPSMVISDRYICEECDDFIEEIIESERPELSQTDEERLRRVFDTLNGIRRFVIFLQ